MVVRLDELVREASEANNRALKAELNAQILLRMNRESELLLLQHQINPHYLFNTFESIRMELVNEGNRELAGIVFSFAQSFRASLYGGESIYPLADEMRLVYSFISIQEYRHPDRVKFEIEIQNGMEQYVLPKLCIQPLLENAVLHGIEEKEGSGIVRLSVLEENDSILIRVYDNGAGMSEEKLASVRSVIYEEEPVGNDQLERRFSALRNVHWRIVLLYGREYGLNIESRLGEFTEVTLRIAKRLQRGGDDDDEMPDRG
jgi:two-component system sensor histidine kinase YesM